jgi:hypothetical protein
MRQSNEHGSTMEQRIDHIRSSYASAIKGNVEYHTVMSKADNERGNKDAAALHLAMAQAYSALVA